jgi:hypothetical protein
MPERSVDDLILRSQAKQEEAARQLRMSRGEVGEVDGMDGYPSLRERKMQAMKQQAIKSQVAEKIKEKISAPAHQGTGMALKVAWLNLIPSYGLTLLYINAHVFLRQVFPSIFCPLGEEWVPKQVLAAGGEAGKMAGKTAGMFEIMGLMVLNFIAFFIIMGIVTILAFIVTWLDAGFWEKLGMIFGGIRDLGWTTLKLLYDLFKDIEA